MALPEKQNPFLPGLSDEMDAVVPAAQEATHRQAAFEILFDPAEEPELAEHFDNGDSDFLSDPPQKAPTDREDKPSLFWRFLEWFAPSRKDGFNEILRKCCFSMAFVLFLISSSYLINDSLLIPYSNTHIADSVRGLYVPNQTPVLTPEEEQYPYPAGISEDFKKLYYTNNDVRGWLHYPSSADSWHDIDYPLVQSSDNDYYLYRDFYKTINKNGTLFFDYRNDFSSPASHNKMTIIYGHNMRSGQMLATLNRLYDIGFARTAPVITLNTLYRSDVYKVFAVFVMDEDEAGHWNYLRTDFHGSDDLQNYFYEVARRSLYTYGDVDVSPDQDEFLMLYTCGNTVQNYLSNGRTVVLARKVREGEDPSVNVYAITENPSPLMPKAWYTKQGLELPPAYR